MYHKAIEDAKTIEENEICSNLTPIVRSNENLYWSGESGDDRVLVNYPTLKKLSDNSISRQKHVKKKAYKAFKSKNTEFGYYWQ